MRISDFSVKHPVFAIVINLLLIVFGLIALERLTLRELPDIDPPVVSIETSYPGAAAQTVENRITKVLERRISGIEGIRFIDAKSIDGFSSINIEFQLSRDIDNAANDIRERVFSVLDELPEGADPPEVFKVDSNSDVIMWFNLASKRWNSLQLTDYADRYLVDRLSVVDGVARVRIGGEKRYAMRIWLDRQAMAGKNVVVSDIVNALRKNNIELPGGRIESDKREFPVWLSRQFKTVEDFANLVIRKEENGHLVRLKEVANVQKSAESLRNELRGNRENMVGLGIIKQSKANTLDVARNVHKVIDQISLPPGVRIVDSYDTSVFIQQSINEVIKTFIIALILVISVILVFLGNIRTLFIPCITIPVAIIATFIVLYSAGFSLNLLTLLGLVLAIGLVVDDAIVVLENINRRIAQGEPPLLASYRGTRQVGFAVIATTVVLLAVFLPISILQGNVGRLFAEFAFTLAAAVVFSTFVALTLTPVLSSLILSANLHHARWSKVVFFALNKLNDGYKKALKICLKHSYLFLSLAVILITLGISLYPYLNKELVPEEDRGAFFVLVKAPEGASFSAMQTNMRQMENILMDWVERDLATRVLSIFPLGFGKGDPLNSGFGIVVMKDFAERSIKTQSVINQSRPKLNNIPGITAIPIMRSSIGSQSLSQPVQFVIGGTSYDQLITWRDKIISKARKNPGLTNIDSDYDPSKIQFNVNIDYDRAADMGVSIQSIGETLESLLGTRDVTTYIDRDEEYDVILEAESKSKDSLQDLTNIYVRSDTTNRLIPLSNLATVEEVTVPNALYRYNRMKSITITASLNPGYSLGQALDFLNQVAKKTLPPEATIDYKDQSKDYQDSRAGIMFTFLLAIIVMYLVMAAQFGSFIHPLVILVTAPLAVTGALFGLFVTKNSINIYSQIGMIMLIGLAAKNAILQIEFINQLREQSVKFLQAVIEGSVIRLRPILMTAISTLFGSIPLILATGAGAESRLSIGIVVFFGISIATFLTLFLVPVVYVKLARHTKPRNATEKQLIAQEKQLSDGNNA